MYSYTINVYIYIFIYYAYILIIHTISIPAASWDPLGLRDEAQGMETQQYSNQCSCTPGPRMSSGQWSEGLGAFDHRFV